MNLSTLINVRSLSIKCLIILCVFANPLFSQQCVTVNNIGDIDSDNDGLCDLYDLDDDNDGILDIDECDGVEVILNGSFEVDNLIAPRRWTLIHDSRLLGWFSSLPSRRIEIWGTGLAGVASPNGQIHVELNSTAPSAIYQRLNTEPGDVIIWSVKHKGRSGIDEAEVRIGGDFASAPRVELMRTGRANFVQYVGRYEVPAGQIDTFFILESVSTHNNSASVGNLLDDVRIFTIKECPDFDLDGYPNDKDLDSDNDGVYDVVESGGDDANDDGRADDDDDNVDNEDTFGIPTSAGNGTLPIDTNTDGSDDFLNLDSDNDGCSDANEAYNDIDADGNDSGVYGVDPATVDSDGLVIGASYPDPYVASQPLLKVVKKVLDNNGVDITGGSVNPGDQLFYELTIENQGLENIINATIKDVLPANTTFNAGTFSGSPGLNGTYTSADREVNITINNTEIERFDGPIFIRFSVSIDSNCINMRDACANVISNTAYSTYTGLDTNITITDEETILDQDSVCFFDIEGAAIITVDLGNCANYEAFICASDVDLIAGGGFANYTWTNVTTGAVLGNSQTLNVTTGGQYRVDKSDTPSCSDGFEIWDVTAFNTITNPIIAVANNPSINGNLRTCPITGDSLPELFLCGNADTILLDSGFVDANSIVWERLDPVDCPTVTRDINCPTLNNACASDWTQVSSSRDYNVSDAGEYRISANFDGGCTITFYFNVFKNNFEPNLKIVRNLICDTPGILRVQNSSSQYEYQLVKPDGVLVGYQSSPEFIALTEQGSYSVNVRQNNGSTTACVFTAAMFVNELDSSISVTTTDPQCQTSRGEAHIQVSNGDINYTYTINSTTNSFVGTEGPTTDANHTFTGLNPDTYDIEVLSYNGECIDQQTITINDSPVFSATTALIRDLSCNSSYQPDASSPAFDPDEFTAIAEVDIIGGSGNYVYGTDISMTPPLLTPEPSTTNKFRFTTTGGHSIFVQDVTSGCIIPAGNILVDPYEDFQATVTAIDPICQGGNGSISIEVLSGEGPYIYVLDTSIFETANGDFTFVNVPVGTHSIDVVDRFSCRASTLSATVEEPVIIGASIVISRDYQCVAGSDTPPQFGQITVSGPSGGTPPYVYSTDGVDFTNTTGIFDNLTDGTYTLYIRDGNTMSCPVNLGDLTIAPIVKVTDLNFDVDSAVQCTALTSDITVTATLDGVSTVEYRISAPAPDITAWSANDDYNDLASGTTYTFEARTAIATDGCIYSENYTVPTIDFIAVNGTVVHEPDCIGEANGELSFTVYGIDLTDTTYNYSITRTAGLPVAFTPITGAVQTTATILTGDVLPEGTYQIVVQDDTTLCTDTIDIIIGEPSPITFTIDILDQDCVANTATIMVSNVLEGSGAGYTYILNDSANIAMGPSRPISSPYLDVPNGNGYQIVVTDSNSCTSAVETFDITQLTQIAAVIDDAASDFCLDDGAITFNIDIGPIPNIGTADYVYNVALGGTVVVSDTSIGALTEFTTPVLTQAGTYVITITDSKGCPVALTMIIEPAVSLAVTQVSDIVCVAGVEQEAVFSFMVDGGYSPYNIDVSTDGGTSFVNHITNGTAPFVNYTATPGAGNYVFRVTDTDPRNCAFITSTYTVAAPIAPVITSLPVDIDCDGGMGTAVITVTGTDKPYRIDFGNTGSDVAIVGTQVSIPNLTEGTYDYTIISSRSCSYTSSVALIAPDPITQVSSSVTSITCNPLDGVTTLGAIDFELAGGRSDYTYTLVEAANVAATPIVLAATSTANPLTTASNSVSFTGLDFGQYYIFVTDEKGCSPDDDPFGPFNVFSRIEDLDQIIEISSTCPGGVTFDISVIGGSGVTPPSDPPPGFRIHMLGEPDPGLGTWVALNDLPNILPPPPGVPNPTLVDANTPIRSHRYDNLEFNRAYILEVEDMATGCLYQTIVAPQDPPSKPDIINVAVTDISCNESPALEDGEIIFDVENYDASVTQISWEVFDQNTNISLNTTLASTDYSDTITGLTGASFNVVIDDLPKGWYYVIVQEDDGTLCPARENFRIDAPDEFKSRVINQTPANSCGTNAQVVMTTSGGTPFVIPPSVDGYTYALVGNGDGDPGVYPLNSNVIDIGNTDGQLQDIWLADAKGCSFGPITVTTVQNPLPTITASFIDDCTYDSSNVIDVDGTGLGNLLYQLDGGTAVVGSIDNNNHQFIISTPGTYTITITDDSGCSVSSPVTIYDSLAISVAFTTIPTCENLDGVITTTTTSGVAIGTITYELQDGGGTAIGNTTGDVSGIYTGIAPGSYIIEATDDGRGTAPGCSFSAPISIEAPTPPVLVEETTFVTCIGDTDGVITAALTLASTDADPTVTYEYEITAGPTTRPIQNSPIFTGLNSGTYTVMVTVTKPNGALNVICTDTEIDYIINEPTDPTATVALESVYGCAGTSINLSVITVDNFTDGNSPYRMSYTDPSGNVFGPLDPATIDTDAVTPGIQIVANEAGNYTFTIYDVNDCPNVLVPISIPPFLKMTDVAINQVANIDCVTNTEEITVTVTGGSGPFDFMEVSGAVASQLGVISGGATTSTSFFLPDVSNYTFRVFDQATQCSIDTVFYDVTPYETITANISVVAPDIQCFGDTIGTVELTVTGNPAGAYNYVATNTNTGLTVIGTGDTSVLNPIEITGLGAGSIQVLVTDPVSSCDDASNIVVISQPTDIDLSLQIVNSGYCNSVNSAIIEAITLGGTGDFEYRLEDLSGTPLAPYDVYSSNSRFENLPHAPAGITYQVRAKDDNNCEMTERVTIVSPLDISIASITGSTLSCYDSIDGTIAVTASGGQGIGTYLFVLIHPNGDQETEITSSGDSYTYTGLSSGNYEVVIRDNLNCTANASAVIDIPVEVSVSVTSVREPSCSNPTADIEITGSGGTSPYEYSPDGINYVSGGNPFIYTNIPESDAAFYVRDTNGCVSLLSNTIPVRALKRVDVVLDLDNTFVVCFGDAAASVDAIATGGYGNYTYTLTGTDYLGTTVNIGPQNLSFFADLVAGNYIYSVNDGDCGPESTPFIISQPNEFIVTETSQDISCNGEADGVITINASGGTPNYVYSLYNSAGNSLFTFIQDDIDNVLGEHMFTDLPADIYTVEVADDKGCLFLIPDIEIIEPLAIEAVILSTTPEACAGDSDGTAIVSIIGGNPGYFWSITGQDGSFQSVTDPTNLEISGLSAGAQTLFIRDVQNSSDCEYLINIDITPGVLLSAQLNQRMDCPILDVDTGVISSPTVYYIDFALDENSASTDIIYSLEGINGTPNPIDNENMTGAFIVDPGTYQGAMLHANGCNNTNVGVITIEEYIPMSDLTVQTTGNTQDVNEYEIILNGGLDGYTYFMTSLDDSDAEIELISNSFAIRSSGAYKIRVVDGSGCEVESTFDLIYINLIIPNYYDPNIDSGWYPYQTVTNDNTPFLFQNLEVKIFDRYGRLLAAFKGDQSGNGWKGIHKGKVLPSGDYWYHIILNDEKEREIIGNFTLHR